MSTASRYFFKSEYTTLCYSGRKSKTIAHEKECYDTEKSVQKRKGNVHCLKTCAYAVVKKDGLQRAAQ